MIVGIEWKDEYSVGIVEFDDDHKHLINLINALDEARERNHDRKHILKIIDSLVSYTDIHFAREEELMSRAGYPGYDSHVEKHRILRGKIIEFYEALKSGTVQEIGDDVLKFLYKWLIYHILNEDKAYCAFFNYHGFHSLHDDRKQKVSRNPLSHLSIRTLSNISLALVLLVMISSAAAGWTFLTGVGGVQAFYEEAGQRTMRKLRLADYLYSRFQPDSAYGSVFANGQQGTAAPGLGADAVQMAFLQIDDVLERYQSLKPSGNEQTLLTVVRAASEEISRATAEKRTPDFAGGQITEAMAAVVDLNRLAFEDFQGAQQHLSTRMDDLSGMVRWVAGANAALIAGLGVYWVWFSRRRLVLPLSAITAALSRLASGDTNADVARASRKDEIGQLIDAFKILRRSALDRNWAQREQEQLSEEITWRRANYDHITGLLNRTLFHDRLEHTLAIARRNGRRFALLFIDLDRFKQVNDTMGHDAGDELLREVGTRLTACVRESDTVARLGGDEFAVVLTEFTDADVIFEVAQRVLESMQKPFLLAKGTACIGASIGIAVYPADGTDDASIVANADAAMYRAKQAGRNTYRTFSEILPLASDSAPLPEPEPAREPEPGTAPHPVPA